MSHQIFCSIKAPMGLKSKKLKLRVVSWNLKNTKYPMKVHMMSEPQNEVRMMSSGLRMVSTTNPKRRPAMALMISKVK